MKSKMQPRMPYDYACLEKSEEISVSWVQQFLEPDILRPIGNFLIRHHNPCEPGAFSILERGAFNICFRMRYENGSSAVIRFPQPGATMFPEEKIRNEVAVMRFIYGKTSIPVPFVFFGNKRELSFAIEPIYHHGIYRS